MFILALIRAFAPPKRASAFGDHEQKVTNCPYMLEPMVPSTSCAMVKWNDSEHWEINNDSIKPYLPLNQIEGPLAHSLVLLSNKKCNVARHVSDAASACPLSPQNSSRVVQGGDKWLLIGSRVLL
jgi:hypothetical protein